MRYEVIFAGIGGQGVILAGTLLGEAAVRSGLKATQTQAYGVSARGGFTKTDLIVSDEEILYPYSLNPDLIIALAEEAFMRYIDVDKDTCKVIYDSGLIDVDSLGLGLDKRFVGVPITNMAIELGSPRSVNILSLGIAVSFIKDISFDALCEILSETFSANTLEKNIEALSKGMELGKSIF